MRVEGQFGEALSTRSRRCASGMQLVSKCGIKLVAPSTAEHRIKHYDSSAAHIIAPAWSSLRPLRTDRLDLLLIHRPDPLMDADADGRRLRIVAGGRQGAALRRVEFHAGTSSSAWTAAFKLVTNQVELHPLVTAPLIDGTLDQLQRLRIGPMIWSPLAGGRLFSAEEPADNLRTGHRGHRRSTRSTFRQRGVRLDHGPAEPSAAADRQRTHRSDRGGGGRHHRAPLSRSDWFRILRAARGHEVA